MGKEEKEPLLPKNKSARELPKYNGDVGSSEKVTSEKVSIYFSYIENNMRSFDYEYYGRRGSGNPDAEKLKKALNDLAWETDDMQKKD